MVTQAKSILSSKTFWSNALVIVGALTGWASGLLTQDQALAGAGLAAGNIGLRFTSTQPVAMVLPSTAKATQAFSAESNLPPQSVPPQNPPPPPPPRRP